MHHAKDIVTGRDRSKGIRLIFGVSVGVRVRRAVRRNLCLGYDPYSGGLWTYFAPIFRKIASQTLKSVACL